MDSTGNVKSCETIKKEAAALVGLGLVKMSDSCIDENNKKHEITCKPSKIYDIEFYNNDKVACSYEGELSFINILIIIFVIILICGPFIVLIINIIRKKIFKKRNNNDYYNSNNNSNNNNSYRNSSNSDDNILPEYSTVNINSISNENNTTTHLPTYEEAIANSSDNNYQS